jgi:hypothetical protein
MGKRFQLRSDKQLFIQSQDDGVHAKRLISRSMAQRLGLSTRTNSGSIEPVNAGNRGSDAKIGDLFS